MRKTFLALLFATSILYAKWYTATSISAGAKYFDDLGNMDLKVEQFFIHSALPKLYYKTGIYREQLARWTYADGTPTTVDRANNIVLGAGYNVLTLGKFFIDMGASVGYRTEVSNEAFTVTISGTDYHVASQYNDPDLNFFGDIGIGYAFGSFTLRLDLTLGTGGKVQLLDTSTGTTIGDEKSYSRLHANGAVAYWW